jgi:predicted transposase/invertase (TIGR01784 family)
MQEEFSLLDPKVDFIFKLIFGNEKHPNILISFLNAVTQPKNKITSVIINNTELEKKHIEDKFSRLDVKATTNKGEVVNIEIQLRNENNMIKRALFYMSKNYATQLKKGEDYSTISKTISINILRFKYLDEEENFHNAYRFKNIENRKELTDVMEVHFIELPKFNTQKEGQKIIENLKKMNKNVNMLEAWTLFLKKPDSVTIRELEDSVPEIKEAKIELTEISADEKTRRLYEMREDAIRDRISSLTGAHKKGLKEGIEKGKVFEKIEMAKKLILKGQKLEFISEITGLSLKKLLELKKSLKKD